MKVSRKWLQKYFDSELPDTAALATALTFRAFEIEAYDTDMLDIKVLPDRACYALSHRGIAYELSAILGLSMKIDPLATPPTDGNHNETLLSITADPAYVIRHTGALMQGVKVEPSPNWLQQALVSVGQRSINNVVDVLNYVMLDIGQPSGAFDVGSLERDGDVVRVDIRRAHDGEKIQVLTGEEYVLTSDMFAFTDAVGGSLLDIAGIKGGLSSGVTESTTDLFISCGTYNPTLLRRTCQKLKLFTDASSRFQNRPSPELTAYGMRDILALIQNVAGGECISHVDFYPTQQEMVPVAISCSTINKRLGSSWSHSAIEQALTRLNLSPKISGDIITVTPPFDRRDIVIPEDVVEEVGRILGYDNVPAACLPRVETIDLRRFSGIERIKDFLVDRGFVEISTPAFAVAGDIELANPLDKTKPYLRDSLEGNMKEALDKAVLVAPRTLGTADAVRLFEIGNVFTNKAETLHLVLGYRPLNGKRKPILEETLDALTDELHLGGSGGDDTAELTLAYDNLEKIGEGYEPPHTMLQKFKPFSSYPFALRDIAVWSPAGTNESEVANNILAQAGELLVRMDLFDRFEKEGRVSHAFHLVFESHEKTLSDTELNPIMERITNALNVKEGWEVR